MRLPCEEVPGSLFESGIPQYQKSLANPINSTGLRYLCDKHGVIIIPGICRYGVNF